MIPLVDLKTQYDQHKEEFQEAINAVLSTTSFVLGKDVESFEKTLPVLLVPPMRSVLPQAPTPCTLLSEQQA